MKQESPIVSAVIPTRNRPELVRRAVMSALNQSYKNLEVIVVVDGPDPDTIHALTQIADERFRIVKLEESVGGGEARNAGARAARGAWIALLDDDDEWFPDKIDKQLKVAETVAGDHVFIASRFIERSENGDRILPARSLTYKGHFSDFLFSREGLRMGTGYLQTSTWFVSKQLMQAAPFTRGLKRNQDVDWMLHAMAVPEAQIHILEEPLTIFYEDHRPGRVSKQPDWKFHFEWVLKNRTYLTARAFAYCIATICVPEAARQGAGFFTYPRLLLSCFRLGRMTPRCFLFFMYNWWIPDHFRTAQRAPKLGRQN